MSSYSILTSFSSFVLLLPARTRVSLPRLTLEVKLIYNRNSALFRHNINSIFHRTLRNLFAVSSPGQKRKFMISYLIEFHAEIQDQSGTEATSAFDWLRVEMITKLPTSILPLHWQQISAWNQQPMSLTVSAINISALLTRNVDNTSGQPISS